MSDFKAASVRSPFVAYMWKENNSRKWPGFEKSAQPRVRRPFSSSSLETQISLRTEQDFPRKQAVEGCKIEPKECVFFWALFIKLWTKCEYLTNFRSFSLLFQNLKNQIMTTNLWVEQVSPIILLLIYIDVIGISSMLSSHQHHSWKLCPRELCDWKQNFG